MQEAVIFYNKEFQVLLSDDLVEVDSNGELLAAQPEEVIMSDDYWHNEMLVKDLAHFHSISLDIIKVTIKDIK